MTDETGLLYQDLISSFLDKQSACNPNIIDAPSLLPPYDEVNGYEYVIGDQMMTISLEDIWQSKTDCCDLSPQQPDITLNPPAGMFTDENGYMSMKVYSQDGANTGPGG